MGTITKVHVVFKTHLDIGYTAQTANYICNLPLTAPHKIRAYEGKIR